MRNCLKFKYIFFFVLICVLVSCAPSKEDNIYTSYGDFLYKTKLDDNEHPHDFTELRNTFIDDHDKDRITKIEYTKKYEDVLKEVLNCCQYETLSELDNNFPPKLRSEFESLKETFSNDKRRRKFATRLTKLIHKLYYDHYEQLKPGDKKEFYANLHKEKVGRGITVETDDDIEKGVLHSFFYFGRNLILVLSLLWVLIGLLVSKGKEPDSEFLKLVRRSFLMVFNPIKKKIEKLTTSGTTPKESLPSTDEQIAEVIDKRILALLKNDLFENKVIDLTKNNFDSVVEENRTIKESLKRLKGSLNDKIGQNELDSVEKVLKAEVNNSIEGVYQQIEQFQSDFSGASHKSEYGQLKASQAEMDEKLDLLQNKLNKEPKIDVILNELINHLSTKNVLADQIKESLEKEIKLLEKRLIKKLKKPSIKGESISEIQTRLKQGKSEDTLNEFEKKINEKIQSEIKKLSKGKTTTSVLSIENQTAIEDIIGKEISELKVQRSELVADIEYRMHSLVSEKINEKISRLNAKLTEVENNLEKLKRASNSNNRSSDSQSRRNVRVERVVSPRIEPVDKNTILSYTPPPKDEIFVKKKLTPTRTPNESIFKIYESTTNENAAKYELITEIESIQFALRMPDLYILSGAEIIGDGAIKDARQIYTREQGVLVKDGVNWKIRKKTIVAYQ